MLIDDVPHITFANTGSGRRIISVIIQACEMVNKDEIFSIHLYIHIYMYIYTYIRNMECSGVLQDYDIKGKGAR